MDYIISPKANADVTVYFGESPVSAAACVEVDKQSPRHCDSRHCEAFHANDENYFKNVYYYITPTLVSNTKFIGNVVYDLVGVAGNQPLAAAYTMVPVTIMLLFLFVARRLGAFGAL